MAKKRNSLEMLAQVMAQMELDKAAPYKAPKPEAIQTIWTPPGSGN